jgi:hypothetical protein
MKMKKFMPFLLFVITALSVNANPSKQFNTAPAAKEITLTQDEANKMISRIYEIKDMNKSNLSAAEKQNLRNELLGIKSKLSGPVTGVYISGGALILLIILLIILL